MTRRTFRDALLVAVLFLLSLAPRIVALDKFVTYDERKWLARSGNFVQAIESRQFARTFQREHPGVITMWMGALGFRTAFPEYPHLNPPQFGWEEEEIEPWLREHGKEPIDLLAAGRRFVALATALAVALCFPLLVRLFDDELLAFGATALISLDPFYLGLSRLLHVDALMTSFSVLALLAFLIWLRRGRSRAALAFSGAMAGLAWLTKSPALFLAPFLGLLALGDAWRGSESGGPRWRAIWQGAVLPMVGWTVVAGATFIVLWPAMWVNPVGSVRGILTAAEEYAVEGHVNANFFLGRVIEDDPGPMFYPIALLWRLTPVVVLGLALLIPALAWIRRERRDWLAPLAGLALWSVVFLAFMTIGAKKFDRYALPVHPTLTILAATGLWTALRAAGAWLGRRSAAGGLRLVGLGGMGLAIVVQGALAFPLAPYYIDFYSPLLGGARVAQRQIFFGWGEGLDEAARYLNAKPDAAQLRVAASYSDGPFDYFFSGESRMLSMRRTMASAVAWLSTDYVVTYINQVQRRLPEPELVEYLRTVEPEYVVERQGVPYAWVYNTNVIEPPPILREGRFQQADFGGLIRLLATELNSEALAPGDVVDITIYLQALAAMERNFSVSVRVVGRDGNIVVQDDGWPWGFPTSKWAERDVLPDGHRLTLPDDVEPGIYQLRFLIYDSETLATLPVTRDDQPVGDSIVLDYIRVESPAAAPPTPSIPVNAAVGEDLSLLGADLPAAAGPGESPAITLYWSVADSPSDDYTRFIHLLDATGALVAQIDSQPLDGFYPTSFWHPGEIIQDTASLPLPSDLPAGTYSLRAGLYNRDGQRLPVMQDGNGSGDMVDLGTIAIQR